MKRNRVNFVMLVLAGMIFLVSVGIRLGHAQDNIGDGAVGKATTIAGPWVPFVYDLQLGGFTIATNLFSNGIDIGIGTTNPGERLDVAGNIRASGTICDSSGCIGDAGGDNGPWIWTAVSGGIGFALEEWQDIPGASITYVVPTDANVRVYFDAPVFSNQYLLHCNLRFVMDGVATGEPTFGDLTVTSLASASQYAPATRTRWFMNQPAGIHEVKIQGRSVPAGIDPNGCHIGSPEYTNLRLEVMAYPAN